MPQQEPDATDKAAHERRREAQRRATAKLAQLLEEAEEQLRAGRTREIGEFAKEFLRKKNISP
jgi:hypothetical protein